MDRCTGCGDCADACDEAVLVLSEPGVDQDGKQVATLSFSENGCSLCGDCARVCRTGAINEVGQERPLPWLARVSGRCLTLSNVHCRSCDDACEPRAIRFPLLAGRVSLPLLDDLACTGCGFCLSVCPANAINLHHRETGEPFQGSLPTPSQPNRRS